MNMGHPVSELYTADDNNLEHSICTVDNPNLEHKTYRRIPNLEDNIYCI